MSMILLSMFISSLVMGVSYLLSKKTFLDKEKISPFECGFDPYLMTRIPFSLRFFKTAIIFLIFDIEIVLVLPLPLILNSFSLGMLYSSIFIIFIIFWGLIFEWQQGSLDWMK